MKIKTKYNIDDKVYVLHNKKIIECKITNITINICKIIDNDYIIKTSYSVINNNFNGYKFNGYKSENEIYTNLENAKKGLINSIEICKL